MASKRLTLRNSSDVGLWGDDVAGKRHKYEIAGLCPEAESWAVQDVVCRKNRFPYYVSAATQHASRERAPC